MSGFNGNNSLSWYHFIKLTQGGTTGHNYMEWLIDEFRISSMIVIHNNF